MFRHWGGHMENIFHQQSRHKTFTPDWSLKLIWGKSKSKFIVTVRFSLNSYTQQERGDGVQNDYCLSPTNLVVPSSSIDRWVQKAAVPLQLKSLCTETWERGNKCSPYYNCYILGSFLCELKPDPFFSMLSFSLCLFQFLPNYF